MSETPESPDKRSLFSDLPSYHQAVPEVRTELVCDECEERTTRATSYTVLHVIFLLVVMIWRVDTVFKCPRCMRRYLLQRLPFALLLSTVFAPVVFVWWTILFVRTLSR